MSNIENTLHGIFSLYLAISFGIVAFRGLSTRLETSKWSETTGTIISQTDSKIFGFVFNCDVKYKYKVDSNTYYGARTNIWGSDTNPFICTRLSESKGKDGISLFFDPKDKEKSVLDNSLDPFYFSVLVVASLYFGYSALMSFYEEKFIPISLVVILTGIYLLISTLAALWVGVSNIREAFASSFLAICIGSYSCASVTKGVYDAYASMQRMEQTSLLQRRTYGAYDRLAALSTDVV